MSQRVSGRGLCIELLFRILVIVLFAIHVLSELLIASKFGSQREPLWQPSNRRHNPTVAAGFGSEVGSTKIPTGLLVGMEPLPPSAVFGLKEATTCRAEWLIGGWFLKSPPT